MEQRNYYEELVNVYTPKENSQVNIVIEKDFQRGLRVSQINKNTSEVLREMKMDSSGRMSSMDSLSYMVTEMTK